MFLHKDKAPFVAYQENRRAEDALKKLKQLKQRITEINDSIDEYQPPEYTGWFVLLKDNDNEPSGFEFVGFFNPDKSDEDAEPEWSVAIPLRHKKDFPEFMGW